MASATDDLVQGMLDLDEAVIDERRERFRKIARLVDACADAAHGAAPNEKRAACAAATKTGVEIIQALETAFTTSAPQEVAEGMIDGVVYGLLPEYEPARDACFEGS